MIVKTIDTDHQLEIRKNSPTRPASATEKSYLRSQFERRQKRQIELTNKMHQQQQQQQPDSVVRSHELIKRRFFEKLERRESMKSARVSNTQNELRQVLVERVHQQPQPSQASLGESGANNWTKTTAAKVAVNEPDGAGTDADEVTSLETIITNNSKSNGTFMAPPPPKMNVHELAAAQVQPPPSDDSKIDDDEQQVDARAGVSDCGATDHERLPRAQSWHRRDAIGAFQLPEALKIEQASGVGELLLEQQKRQPSKEDLHDGPQTFDGEDEQHERLRLFGLQPKQQQQHREQYANPRSPFANGPRGSHANDDLGANNANHDQYGCHAMSVRCSSVQVFAGMQFNNGEKGDGINLLGRSSSSHNLIEPLQQQEESEKCPVSVEVQVLGHKKNGGKQNNCDTTQRTTPMMSSPIDRGLEEDVGSSCSSSGFGASVSAGFSSGSSSDGHHQADHRHPSSREDKKPEILTMQSFGQNDHYRRPNSLRYDVVRAGDSHKPQIQMSKDDIAQFEIVVGKQDDSRFESTRACKQSLSVGLGEDQTLENDSDQPLLHVENHGYGSLANGCRTMTTTAPIMRNQTDKRRWPLVNAGDVSSELDLYANRQYVNLPAADIQESSSSSSATVGYAIVRPRSLVHNPRGHSAGLANIPPTGNNGHSPSLPVNNNHGLSAKVHSHHHHHLTTAQSEPEDCGSSLSGHDSSTSSANTGGFSKLPPVRLIDHHFVNNFDSSKVPSNREAPSPTLSMEGSNSTQQQAKKSPSLLKRFGSLVSRAFTSSNSSGGSGDGDGGEFRSDQCSISGHNSQGSGAKSDANHEQAAATSIPAFEQPCLHEFRNGIQESLREHKSMGSCGRDRVDRFTKPVDTSKDHDQQKLMDLNRVEGSVAGTKSLVLAEADLVILSTKQINSRKNQQVSARGKGTAGTDNHHHGAEFQLRRNLNEIPLNSRSRPVDKFSSRPVKQHCSRKNRLNERRKLTRKVSDASLSRRSSASTNSSCSSSFTSSEHASSFTSSSTQDLTMIHQEARSSNNSSRRRHLRSLRRASSLSDELESLMSPSEVASLQQTKEDNLVCESEKSDRKPGKLCQIKFPIMEKNFEKSQKKSKIGLETASNKIGHQPDDATNRSRSIMRWFSVNGSAGSSPSPLVVVANSVAKDDGNNSIRYKSHCETRTLLTGRDEPKSLIGQSHANSDYKLDYPSATDKTASMNSKVQKRFSKEIVGSRDLRERPSSLMYTSLDQQQHCHSLHGDNGPKQYRRKPRDENTSPDHDQDYDDDQFHDDELVVGGGKCQSLNLYQTLLHNYVKRRNHGHHHRHRHHHSHHSRGHRSHHHNHGHSSNNHHHHHHHHNKHSSSSRHAYYSSTRCGGDQLGASGGKTHDDKASVWGQLIKINKSDGSQVIELQRAPDRSWGFFVARGAINNKKGIFISRMHDNSTGSSLSGLLSIGDQILSIDNYIIEPDFDILRVNQMISKKSKISLGVKPFKG